MRTLNPLHSALKRRLRGLAALAVAACAPLATAQEMADDKIGGKSNETASAAKVEALLKRMTLEEKVGQLHQLSGRQLTGPGSEKFSDKLAAIRSGSVGSMLNVKGVAETREIQALACNRA